MGIREQLDREVLAAHMPHRSVANPLDTRLESTLGRFCYHNLISQEEFEAGVRYGQIVLAYLQSIDAPDPYGQGFDAVPGSRWVSTVPPEGYGHSGDQRRGEGIFRQRDDFSDDECFRRKILCAQGRQVLKDAARAANMRGTSVIAAVDNLAVYGQSPKNDSEMRALHVGLRALARGSSVIPFARHSPTKHDSRGGVGPVAG